MHLKEGMIRRMIVTVVTVVVLVMMVAVVLVVVLMVVVAVAGGRGGDGRLPVFLVPPAQFDVVPHNHKATSSSFLPRSRSGTLGCTWKLCRA